MLKVRNEKIPNRGQNLGINSLASSKKMSAINGAAAKKILKSIK
jgi:hypothetical protein